MLIHRYPRVLSQCPASSLQSPWSGVCLAVSLAGLGCSLRRRLFRRQPPAAGWPTCRGQCQSRPVFGHQATRCPNALFQRRDSDRSKTSQTTLSARLPNSPKTSPSCQSPTTIWPCSTLAKASLTRLAPRWKWRSVPTPATPPRTKTWATCMPSWPAKPTARLCSWTTPTPACNPSCL